jgi:hypothetical protein
LRQDRSEAIERARVGYADAHAGSVAEERQTGRPPEAIERRGSRRGVP